MLSLPVSASHFIFSHFPYAGLSHQRFPSFTLVVNSPRRRRRRRKIVSLSFVAAEETDSSFGFSGLSREGDNRYKGLYCGCSRFVGRCEGWDSGGEISLEAEILEFMKNSNNPKAFPSRKELIDAGRMDLVDAIVEKGGWLSFGWDLDGEKGQEFLQVNFNKNSGAECGNAKERNEVEGSEVQCSSEAGSYFPNSHSHPPTSSSRSLEMEAEGESGIEGILNRLEKERNVTFGVGRMDKVGSIAFPNDSDEEQWQHRTSADGTVAGLESSGRLASLKLRNSGLSSNFQSKLSKSGYLSSMAGLRNLVQPEMWRTWSIQRAGFSDSDFEAAEIAPFETRRSTDEDVLGNGILEVREIAGEPTKRENELHNPDEKINHNDIRIRLEHLESELSYVLRALRSGAEKGHETSMDDLQKFSDAWEFQENEIMNAQDRLRSIRAKLAVLEGKMALAIIDAQKTVANKQKRINEAHRALQLLRTACIVWPSSASQVLLAGSYDGWATQRKMEKSNTGIFSLCLKLYPGRYEIKFIVDGEWKVDPLRPIVHNNGHENNLLIIT